MVLELLYIYQLVCDFKSVAVVTGTPSHICKQKYVIIRNYTCLIYVVINTHINTDKIYNQT